MACATVDKLNNIRQFDGWSMASYLQIFNAGKRKNVRFIDCDFRNSLPDIDEQSIFPVLPTIGINFVF